MDKKKIYKEILCYPKQDLFDDNNELRSLEELKALPYYDIMEQNKLTAKTEFDKLYLEYIKKQEVDLQDQSYLPSFAKNIKFEDYIKDPIIVKEFQLAMIQIKQSYDDEYCNQQYQTQKLMQLDQFQQTKDRLTKMLFELINTKKEDHIQQLIDSTKKNILSPMNFLDNLCTNNCNPQMHFKLLKYDIEKKAQIKANSNLITENGKIDVSDATSTNVTRSNVPQTQIHSLIAASKNSNGANESISTASNNNKDNINNTNNNNNILINKNNNSNSITNKLNNNNNKSMLPTGMTTILSPIAEVTRELSTQSSSGASNSLHSLRLAKTPCLSIILSGEKTNNEDK